MRPFSVLKITKTCSLTLQKLANDRKQNEGQSQLLHLERLGHLERLTASISSKTRNQMSCSFDSRRNNRWYWCHLLVPIIAGIGRRFLQQQECKRKHRPNRHSPDHPQDVIGPVPLSLDQQMCILQGQFMCSRASILSKLISSGPSWSKSRDSANKRNH